MKLETNGTIWVLESLLTHNTDNNWAFCRMCKGSKYINGGTFTEYRTKFSVGNQKQKKNIVQDTFRIYYQIVNLLRKKI